ncbi:unnamed protein product [Dovyalis caffra]|uniref:Uncharacterized protein n=1 Tax=Dovyalis caffra TaxID=77055 RepID=A0AAV1SX48_9ROSI|nr:unnamed protein product [Dovyalis caffra]
MIETAIDEEKVDRGKEGLVGGRQWSKGREKDFGIYTILVMMPSLLPDAPQYPSVHKAFNNTVIQEEETTEVPQDYVNRKNPAKSPKKAPKKAPKKVPKKVQVMDQVQFIEQNGNQKSEVVEDSVDDEAEGFIQQKRKGFELCKWKTFKLP